MIKESKYVGYISNCRVFDRAIPLRRSKSLDDQSEKNLTDLITSGPRQHKPRMRIAFSK